MPAAAAVAATVAPVLVLAASEPLPSWVDTVSRVGVVGFLALALFGLYRQWWAPRWVVDDLKLRLADCTSQRDEAITVALQSSRGVEKSANLLEQAIARGIAGK